MVLQSEKLDVCGDPFLQIYKIADIVFFINSINNITPRFNILGYVCKNSHELQYIYIRSLPGACSSVIV